MKKMISIFILLSLMTAGLIIFPYSVEPEDITNSQSPGRGGARGNTLYVGGSGVGNYTKIQDAIDNANSGDNIRVFDGTYNETLVIDKKLNLIGNGSSNTVLDAKQKYDAIAVNSSNCTIDGFYITGAGYSPTGYRKSGIKINNDFIKVSNCDLYGNHYGMRIENRNNITIENTGIFGSYIFALELLNLENITIDKCKLNSNFNGIHLRDSDNFQMGNSECNSNNYGIQILYSSNGIIEYTKFYKNSYDSINIYYSSKFKIINNNFIINGSAGVYLETGANYNQIYHNNFFGQVSKNFTCKFGHDKGSNNKWDNGIEGNHWWNWTFPDKNNDGIVDYPYNLSGSSSSKDNYPLVFPYQYSKGSVINTRTNLSYSKIQEAVNNANSGDTLRVWAGLYYENVIINKQIFLYGNGSSQTIINGNKSGNVIRINADSCKIKGLKITNAFGHLKAGIYIYGGYNQIESCYFYNNPYGIYVNSCHGTIIRNNTLVNNEYSNIYLQKTISSTLKNNKMFNGGLYFGWDSVSHWNSHDIDTTNKVNNKPIQYWKDKTNGVVPLGAGQVILANCNSVEVKNQNISDSSTGIFLAFSNNNSIHNNSFIDHKEEGIHIHHSNDNIIELNELFSNKWGIYTQFSKRNIFNKNKIYSSLYFGINIGNGLNNVVKNNQFINNSEEGIEIFNSGVTIIKNNYCCNNTIGIKISRTDKPIIENNTLFYNNRSITIDSSDYCTLTRNFLFENDYGLSIGSSSDFNIIYNNDFVNNNEQARDNGELNKWNNSIMGNYWSDWTTPDENNDGIVDIPYNINGSAGAKDYRPLTKPNEYNKFSPKILTKNIKVAYVGKYYTVNYTAMDIDTTQEKLTWVMKTNTTWLTFSSSHELYGTPQKSDVGLYCVNISVSDGNHLVFTNFTLKVFKFLPPKITTTNVFIAYVGKYYTVNYTAKDPDTPQQNLTWTFGTNASWLSFSNTQELFGSPLNSDIGLYWINISVSDGKLMDFTNFTLTVLNKTKPQPPIPTNGTVIIVRTGQRFTRIQNAIDNASSGDTIRVWAGKYIINESLIVDITLTLIGNGSEDTNIISNKKGYALEIQADWCNISGFNISGAKDLKRGEYPIGMLIQSNNNSINDLRFEHNISGGIYIYPNYYNLTFRLFNETCNYNIIENCTFRSIYRGIYLMNTSFNKISNCVFDQTRGIGIDGSDNNKITNCAISKSLEWAGINITSSDFNIISNCTFSSNHGNGIAVIGSNNNFENNNFVSNKYGVSLPSDYNIFVTNHNLITKNNFKNNEFGVWIMNRFSQSNFIYLNNFISGNNTKYQAMDDCGNNIWNTSSKGNHWSDWTSPDKNNDGIVDLPYNISGSAGAKDHYPLTKMVDIDIKPPINESLKVSYSGIPHDSNNILVNISYILIKFSKSMNRTSVEDALSISPNLNFTLKWNNKSNELKIIFNEKLKYNTSYQILINSSAKDINGNNLQKPFKLVFTTEKESIESNDGRKKSEPINILVYVIVILIIITFLLLLSFFTMNRRKKREGFKDKEREKSMDLKLSVDENSTEMISHLTSDVLLPDKPSDFGLSKQEMLMGLKEKYDKGEISKETYDTIFESSTNHK